jgi:hypothetical protein
METATAYTLAAYFRDETDSGKIIYRLVNGEDKENAAIVKKYGAYGSSLFINRVIDGTDHIEQVSDLWLLIGDNEAFPEALRDRIKQSLEGKK